MRANINGHKRIDIHNSHSNEVLSITFTGKNTGRVQSKSLHGF